MNAEDRDVGYWTLLGPGWLLLLCLVYAQAIPAFNYELGVAIVLPPIAWWAVWGTWRLIREVARSAGHT